MQQDANAKGPANAELPNRILVVDDDPTVAKGLGASLSRYKIGVQGAPNLETALYLYNQNRFDVVLVELEFGELPGLALIQKWRNHEFIEKRSAGFVLMCGKKRTSGEDQLARELSDIEMINKPFTPIQILPVLGRCVATHAQLFSFNEMKYKTVDFFVQRNDYNKAIDHVKKCIPKVGQRGIELLVELYEKADRKAEALTMVNSLVSKNPHNIDLLNRQGRLLLSMERWQEAKMSLEQADKVAPGNIERVNTLVDLYLKLQTPEAAVEKMKETVKLHPEMKDMKFEMFGKLYDHGFDDHALAYGKASAEPMEVVRFYNNKGVAMSKARDENGAILQYKRALKFFPEFKENYRIHYNIALACLNKKSIESYKEARVSLTKCLTLSPEFDKARKTLALVETTLQKAAQQQVAS